MPKILKGRKASAKRAREGLAKKREAALTRSSLEVEASERRSPSPQQGPSSTPEPGPSQPEARLTASEKKLNIFHEFFSGAADNSSSIRLISMNILASMIDVIPCPKCNAKKLTIKETQNKGFIFRVQTVCDGCGNVFKEAWSSEKMPDDDSFEVNKRLALHAISTGVGHQGLVDLGVHLGTPVMSHSTFDKKAKDFEKSSISSLEESFQVASKKIREAYMELDKSLKDDDIIDISVGYDGTWHRRGHQSNYGIGIAIETITGLVIDCELLSKHCRVCTMKKKGMTDHDFKEWFKSHEDKCQKNYEGSSGAMEVEAAVKIWQRSISKYKLRYTEIISDGDSKSFLSLSELQVYGPNIKLEKMECVNHVAKRMRTALEKASQEHRLGGKGTGSLTAEMITRLQGYYHSAIRNNRGNLQKMRAAVFATLFHSISTDDKPLHQHCPDGENSWCVYRRAKFTNERIPPHKPSLQFEVGEQILGVYQRLGSEELLRRCLHGTTQNANEALNSLIWNKCPKTKFVSKIRVSFAVSMAVRQFNGGRMQEADFMRSVNLLVPDSTISTLEKLDKARKRRSKEHDSKEVKSRRRRAAITQLQEEQCEVEKEGGPSYAAGEF